MIEVQEWSLLARQITNNTLLILDVVLLAFISMFLFRRFKEEVVERDWDRVGWSNYYYDTSVQMATAVFILMLGHTIIRAWGAVLLWHLVQGHNPFDVEEKWPFSILGLCVSVVGMLCFIRIASRDSWGNIGWLLAAGAAIVFNIFMQVIL